MTGAMLPTSDIIVERSGALGRIRLNRPRALNSLTLDMVREMAAALDAFQRAPDITAVLVTGEGERGLCAGGDIKAVHESGRRGDGLAEIFFREEYRLNARIAAFQKPYVAIMDGITMGGGVGISAHGRHRIVTERTRLAMPETGIGFVTDVGATWLLSRGRTDIGTYMALTGEAVGGAEAIQAGLADHLVASSDLPALVAALSALPTSATPGDVPATIARFGRDVAPTALANDIAGIAPALAGNDVQKILADLDMPRPSAGWPGRPSSAGRRPV